MQNVEQWPTEKLIEYARNPRKNDHVVDKVASAIKEFGFRVPILAKSDGSVIDGHLRIKAAKKLGMKTVPVLLADDMTDVQIKAFRISVNKMADLAEWDDDLLKLELEELKSVDFNIDLAGFDGDELAKITADKTEGKTDPDEIPEAPETPKSERGKIYQCGKHRVMCGDSTSGEDVARLMGKERAGLMNTDPPYGVAYANEDRPNPGVAKPRVANDEMTDEKLQEFLEAAFKSALNAALLGNAAWYMWHAHLTQGYFAAAAAAAADVILHRQIIWVKPVLLLGRGHYHWKHEPCFMGWVKGKQPPDYGKGEGERTQTTVWEIGSVTQAERKDFNHPTPKPVELFEIPIIKHLKHGEICYEPFSGSGPQMIAAEKTSRICYGMEISPAYVDVIRKRWAEFVHGKGCDWEALTPEIAGK